MTLPTDRSPTDAADTPQEHADDHNTLHAFYNDQSGSDGATMARKITTAQSTAHATHTAVTLNEELFDDDNLHDNSTNPSRFTIAVTGRYEITAQLEIAVNTTGIRAAYIWKNGVGTGAILAAQKTGPIASGGARLNVATGVVALTAGDYVELGAYQESTGALDVSVSTATNNNTFMSLRRIS